MIWLTVTVLTRRLMSFALLPGGEAGSHEALVSKAAVATLLHHCADQSYSQDLQVLDPRHTPCQRRNQVCCAHAGWLISTSSTRPAWRATTWRRALSAGAATLLTMLATSMEVCSPSYPASEHEFRHLIEQLQYKWDCQGNTLSDALHVQYPIQTYDLRGSSSSDHHCMYEA